MIRKSALWPPISISVFYEFSGLLGPWKWNRNVVPKRRYGITTLRCVISNKSADLIYIAAEAWNHETTNVKEFVLETDTSGRGRAQSVERLTKGWTVLGSNPGGGEIFRICPHRPWGPPSLPYHAYRVFPGGKARGEFKPRQTRQLPRAVDLKGRLLSCQSY